MKGLKLIKINPNQTLFDVAIQVYGHVEGITWLLADNPDVLVTDTPMQVQIRPEQIKKEIVAYLDKNTFGLSTAVLESFTLQQHNEFTSEFNIEFN